MFSRTDLTTLIETAPDVGVSLYLPTRTHGRETRQNPIMLKNLLGQARDGLATLNIAEREAALLLEPAVALVEDFQFWQHQDHGLALFLSDEGMQVHKLPISVPELAVTGQGYNILPLLPLQEQDANFAVLTMTAEAAQVWQATRFALTAIDVEGLPASIGSLDGEPDYEGMLQSHGFGRPNTGGQNMPKTQVYGDSPEEWRKGRLVEFTRRTALALSAHLARHPQRVVVVADATIGGHVRNDEALAPLVAGFVEANPSTLDEAGLLDAASAPMRPIHDAAVETALDRFEVLFGRGDATACTDPATLISAAQDGRVEHLYLAREAGPWGETEAGSGATKAEDEASPELDRFNKAAQMTLQNGGHIWLVAQDRLPEDVSMAAVLRY